MPVALVLVAGCGSSGPDRGRLLNRFSAQVAQSSLNAPDLRSCLLAQARGLPTPQLQKVANSGANPDPSARALSYHLIGACVSQGHGASTLRAGVVAGVISSASPSTPRALVSCVIAKARALPNSALAQLVEKGAQGEAVSNAASRQAGRDLATQCLQDPGVLSLLREKFLSPVRSGLRTTHFSPAFQACVLRKAEAVSIAQLRQLFSLPATANARGNALGRSWAQDCLASGVRP